MSDTEVMTTNDVADELGTDAKTLRKFFRSDACDIVPVGQGKRYAITPDDIESLQEAFNAWSTGKAKKATADEEEDAEPTPDKAPAKGKAKKAPRKTKKKADPEPVLEDEDLDLDDDEPTSDDLQDALEELELDEEDLEV